MGLIEEGVGAVFGELFQGVSLFQGIIEFVLIGAFVYFILTRYWWKPKPVDENKK